jgi:hypothetical protein
MALDDLIGRLESGGRINSIDVRRFKPVKATVAEIREAAAANPDHPLASIMAESTYDMPASLQLVVDHNDLLGLATNREVHIRTSVQNGSRVSWKEIGELRTKVAVSESPEYSPSTPQESVVRFIDEPGVTITEALEEDEGSA